MANSDAGFHLCCESFQKVCPIFMEKVASFQKMFVPLFWTFLLTNLQQSLDELRPYTVKQLSIIIQPTGELNIL